jgi:hypothetical protein
MSVILILSLAICCLSIAWGGASKRWRQFSTRQKIWCGLTLSLATGHFFLGREIVRSPSWPFYGPPLIAATYMALVFFLPALFAGIAIERLWGYRLRVGSLALLCYWAFSFFSFDLYWLFVN